MTKNTCKVRLLDEVTAVIVGLHDDHLNHLYNKFAIPAANYFFHPKFKLGQWDGKIRYFQKTGRTFVYLLEDILPLLVRFGYNVNIEDLRTTSFRSPDPITNQIFAHVPHLDTGAPTILRDDQVEAVNKLIEAGSGVCLAATGAGKTLLCSALVQAYSDLGIKSLTIVPDQGLIRQTKAEYINCGLDTGEYSGTHKTLDHQHVVSTWQALKNNPKIVELFQLVIVDECHGLRGPMLREILCDHAARLPHRFGFTGTLPKDEAERMSVHVAVGPVRHTMEAKTLIDMGILANIHIDVIQLEEDLNEQYKRFCEEEVLTGKPPTYSQFKDGYFPDFDAEKSYIHRNEMRIEWIAEFLLAKQDSRRGNVLCLVDSIPFGRKIAERIPNAIFVNGQDIKTAAKRQQVYDMFKTRDDLVVIATVHIAGTGLNIRRIFNLVFVDIGKSFTRVIQGIGRGLRKAEDKDSVVVTDICSDLKYGKKHLKMRTNYYEEAHYPYKKHKVDYVKQLTMFDSVE